MNRRQRRAKGPDIQTADDIPLARPRENAPKPKAKTLYEIAAERQAQMGATGRPFSLVPQGEQNVKYVKITPDGKTVDVADGEEIMAQAGASEEQTSPLFETFFLASTLSALHFTLETLTVHQYAVELRFPPIVIRTLFVAFPTLFLAIHLFHGHLVSLPPAVLSEKVKTALKMMQQIIFVLVANVAGCYLIHLTNDKGYYAVMKKAPSIGTIWVWSVLELGLFGALAGVIGPGIFAWYHGHSIY